MADFNKIKEIISVEHRGDDNQLKAIFSDKNKLVIEAPAGSGKTKSLVSKIAVLLASGKISKNKKILALTFGVSAAYKIKKDISSKLPLIDNTFIDNPSSLNKKITITNFHGFARRVLKLYGYLLNQHLQNFDILESIEDSDIKKLMEHKTGISLEDAQWITDFNKKIIENEVDYVSDKAHFIKYANYHYNYFLPKGKITYNGYLVLLLELFRHNNSLLAFYNSIYEAIIVDEFQDTNMLAWNIIKMLVKPETKLFFFGDSLQRIYGFIGAIEDLLQIATKEFDMETIFFQKNYRFENNAQLLLIDKNIRRCSESIAAPLIAEDADIDLAIFNTQNEEAEYISKYLELSTKSNPATKIALLTKQKGKNVNLLLDNLDLLNIDYFNGLFSEEDSEYINYHLKASELFTKVLRREKPKRLSIVFFNKVLKENSDFYKNPTPIIKSLLSLTSIFYKRLNFDYNFLSDDEKIDFVVDTFISRSLKQNMEYLNTNIILTTVHGAKGVEWQNVILMDMEDYCFPNYYGLCGQCKNTYNIVEENWCMLNLAKISSDKVMAKQYISELSVFYVAVTRARNKLLLTSSLNRINYDGQVKDCKHSCLLSLPGLIPNTINVSEIKVN